MEACVKKFAVVKAGLCVSMIFAVSAPVLAQPVYDQETFDLRPERKERYSSKGLRVSFGRPIVNFVYPYWNMNNGAIQNHTITLNNPVMLSLGYSSFPLRGLGWSTNVTYLQADLSANNPNGGSYYYHSSYYYTGASTSSASVSMVRGDISLGSALNRYFVVKGGVNLSHFLSNSAASLSNLYSQPQSTSTYSGFSSPYSATTASANFSPSLGLQASIGYQATENFGVDLAFIQTAQSSSFGASRYSWKQSGFEINLHGTF